MTNDCLVEKKFFMKCPWDFSPWIEPPRFTISGCVQIPSHMLGASAHNPGDVHNHYRVLGFVVTEYRIFA